MVELPCASRLLLPNALLPSPKSNKQTIKQTYAVDEMEMEKKSYIVDENSSLWYSSKLRAKRFMVQLPRARSLFCHGSVRKWKFFTKGSAHFLCCCMQ